MLSTYVVQEPANAQQTFSSLRFPTVWRTIPVLEFLQEAWENIASNEKFQVLQAPIEAGLEKLRKWNRKVDETDAYLVSLLTCPICLLLMSFPLQHLIRTSN
jgi:hypothetical protein